MVHQLRVSIKRLRAVLHFTGSVIGNEGIDAKKQFKSLRKLFKITGRIRDVQVQQKLIPEFEVSLNSQFGLYLAYLKKLEKPFVRNFYLFINDSKPIHKLASGRELVEKSLASLSPAEIRIRAEQLLASRFNHLKEIFASRPDDKKLHEMRTIIKQMKYIMIVMHKSAPDSDESPISLANLTEAEELLGNWHDVVVGIEFLKNFRENADFKHSSDSESYKLLAKKLADERLKLRRQIRISLGKSLSD